MMKNSLLSATGTNSTNKITQSSNIRLFDGFVTLKHKLDELKWL